MNRDLFSALERPGRGVFFRLLEDSSDFSMVFNFFATVSLKLIEIVFIMNFAFFHSIHYEPFDFPIPEEKHREEGCKRYR